MILIIVFAFIGSALGAVGGSIATNHWNERNDKTQSAYVAASTWSLVKPALCIFFPLFIFSCAVGVLTGYGLELAVLAEFKD